MREPLYYRTTLRTFEVSFYVTLLCLVFGYPLAHLLTIVSNSTRGFLVALILVPLFTAFLIRTYAWMIILGRQGIVNLMLIRLGVVAEPLEILHTAVAVYIGMCHVLMPIAVFTMYATMSQIDRNLVRAAHVLGATPVQAFLRVYFPLTLPGVLAAGLLIFVLAIGFYITPALLGGPSDTMISQLIVTQATTLLNFEMSFSLAVLLLTVTLIVLAVGSLIVPIELMWVAPGAAGFSDHRASRLHRLLQGNIALSLWKRVERMLDAARSLISRSGIPLLYGYGAALIFFFLAPLLVVVVLSFSSSNFIIFPPPGISLKWYQKLLAARPWHSAFFFSIELATSAALVSTAVGTSAAFALVRGRIAGKRILFLLTLAPMVIPTIVLAIALYFYFAKLRILGTFLGLVLAHVVLTVPYSVVVMTSAVRGLDRSFEEAAAIHGARPLQTLWSVMLPLLRPALLTSGLLAFLTSFDELLVSIFLLGRQTQTLPIKFWSDINMQIDPLLSAAATVIVGIVTAVVLSARLLRGRKEAAVAGSLAVRGK